MDVMPGVRAQRREVLMNAFIKDGFVIGDGLKYGVDLLLYTDDPSKVHSRYGVLIDDGYSMQDIIGIQRTCASANKEMVLVFFAEDGFEMVLVERMQLKNVEEIK
ncbi:putative tRNA-intron endonuclease [Ordospora pajunii]|uniref:putative tRNA-intron endonuclease n=1 Tax=Ordospora pajunii TaxID=3039483 RepID=UPI0029526AEA|nr:putative tRNA-intron endonuclease [Ordospora pajunii]KAH9411768.1 putative tRNA-intron endonuclease [Ordospora pajunii]